MKFLGYIFRNARRNPTRSILTIGSIAVCGFLTMVLLSLFAINQEVGASTREYNRLLTMSAQGFGQALPIALVNEIVRLDEQSGTKAIVRNDEDLPCVSPFAWYGGRYGEETFTTFAQFGIDPDVFFSIYYEIKVPPEQLQAFRDRKDGAIIGHKLAKDKGLKIGDPFPLKGTFYEQNLDLTVVGIYDGPAKRDMRMCFFDWEYLNEGLKRNFEGRGADNAGTVVMLCKDAASMPALAKVIDEGTRNSDTPTKTQTEEAFVAMFAEMIGDLQTYINWLGLAVAMALVMVCGVSMAMTMRERTTEIAVLKAIGFRKGLILFLVLSEAILIAGLGGLVGAIGTKLLFDFWDISPYSGGFLTFFYVPWWIALTGLAGALVIGLVSGLVPAIQASRIPVVDGLRRVV